MKGNTPAHLPTNPADPVGRLQLSNFAQFLIRSSHILGGWGEGCGAACPCAHALTRAQQQGFETLCPRVHKLYG